MKQNKETLNITTPVGVVLESDAKQLQLDRIAFSLKENNTFEIAKLLYSTKEAEGLSRHLDKIIKNRIQEIKAMVTVGNAHSSIYEAGAIPEEFLHLSKENNIPLIVNNQ